MFSLCCILEILLSILEKTSILHSHYFIIPHIFRDVQFFCEKTLYLFYKSRQKNEKIRKFLEIVLFFRKKYAIMHIVKSICSATEHVPTT